MGALLGALLAGVPAGAAPAGVTPNPERVAVMVLVPGVSLRELWETPTAGIHGILTTGAVGVMNSRTGPNTGGRTARPIDSLVLHPEEIRPSTLEAAYLTLGAGTRLFTRAEGGQAFEADEPAEGGTGASVWRWRTGHRPESERIFHTAIPQVIARQERLRYDAAPGALGQALREAGIPVAVVGNADDVAAPHREAVCVAMDALGRVPLGAIGKEMARPAPFSPGGRRTDALAVLAAARDALAQGARFLVVETGDTARADRATEEIRASVRPFRRQQAIRSADRIVSGLLATLDPAHSLLILVAPAPSMDAAREGNTLTPVVLAGAGVRRGLLFSPSTRTPGLATNTDLAPTVLEFLGAALPAQMVGRPLASTRDIRARDTVLALEARFARVEEYGRPLARWLVWGQVTLFGIFLFLAWVRPAVSPGRARALRVAALAVASLPAAVLLLGRILPASAPVGGGFLAAILAVLVGAALLAGRWVSAGAMVWLAGAAIGLYDLGTGNAMLRSSPLGYSPYAGARYYGIGNEGFGLLLAALVPATIALWPAAGSRRRPTRVLLAAAAAALAAGFLIGHPALGANFGGALAGAATGAALAALGLRGRISRRALAWVALIGLAVAAAPVLWDALSGAERQSHVGRALASIQSGGPAAVWAIIARKLAMNFRLLRFSPWSRLLLMAVVAAACLVRRYGPSLRRERPTVWRAALALSAGAVVALLANDSGVQPAAEMMAGTAAMLALYADEKREA